MNAKNKKSFIEKNENQDKLLGRPIRLNKVELLPQAGKDYASLIFFGDSHIGHPQCHMRKVQDILVWALDTKTYILIMGDLMECGLRDSIGDSVYQQRLNPQKQMETVIKLLRPAAKEKLIIGLHQGNHEMRITKNTGIDIGKIMAKQLGVRYLNYSCWSLLTVGKQKFSLYSTHGHSGARFKHTQLKSVMDLAHWIEADIIAQGHVHGLAAETIIKQMVDSRRGVVKEKKCYVVLTGSYLQWDRSYAQMLNMGISRLGSPKVKLNLNDNDLHFSL